MKTASSLDVSYVALVADYMHERAILTQPEQRAIQRVARCVQDRELRESVYVLMGKPARTNSVRAIVDKARIWAAANRRD